MFPAPSCLKSFPKGDTKLTAVVLAISGAGPPASGTLPVNGGKVNLTGPVTVATLVFAGAPQASGTWGATGSGAKNIDDTRFAGSDVLTVSGK